MAFLEPKDRAIVIQDLQEEDYDYIALIRTSTTEQEKSIDQQRIDVESRMSQLGFSNPVFVEVSNVSGAKADREQIKKIMDFIKSRPVNNRNLIVVARDPARFSRNTLQGLLDQSELEDLGVYLYLLNANLLIGGKGVEQGNARLQFQLLLSVSTFAKFDETVASVKGRAKAKREKGIQGGTARDTFRENIPKSGAQKGKTIYRRISESIGALNSGTLTVKGLARELSNSTRTIYPKVVRDIKREVENIIELVGLDGLQIWLNVWDELVRYEGFRSVGRLSKPVSKRGTGSFRQTERARALWRVSQGFINNPQKWKDPVLVGNPEVATFPSPQNTGTLEHAYRNPLQYIPQAR